MTTDVEKPPAAHGTPDAWFGDPTDIEPAALEKSYGADFKGWKDRYLKELGGGPKAGPYVPKRQEASG